MLNNNAHVGRSIPTTKDMSLGVLGSDLFINVVFNVRGADVTSIFCSNVCPLTWAFLLHMAKSLAAVTLKAGHASRRSHGGCTLCGNCKEFLLETKGRAEDGFGIVETPESAGHVLAGGGARKE